VSSQPLLLGSRRRPMAVSQGVAGGMPPATLLPGVLDARAVSGTMMIRERGEADAAEAERLGRELARTDAGTRRGRPDARGEGPRE
jgi:hypothetical protein